MTHASGMIVCAALLAAAGCTTQPAPTPADMDIDFVRGCWVQKAEPGGKIQAFLRLLPDGDNLSGQIADVGAGGWDPGAAFRFARTGVSATFRGPAMPEPPEQTRIEPSRLAANFDWARPQFGGKLAAYAEAPPSRNFLFAEAGNERLSIWAVSAQLDATLIMKLFDGERDGCD